MVPLGRHLGGWVVTRDWDESEHPRHPRGSGRDSGRFRHGGLSTVYRSVHAVDNEWARKLSQRISDQTGGGTWSLMTPAAYRGEWRREMLAELRRQGTPEPIATETLNDLESDAGLPEVIYRNGPHRVVVETDRDLPDGFLDMVSDLQRRYPGRGPSTTTLLDRRAMPNERGLTLFPSSIVFIRDDNLDGWDPQSREIAMPVARRASGASEQWRYILAHEWGHVITPADVLDNPRKSEEMYGANKRHFGEYGAHSAVEAIGEAFAEWYLTGGETTNPGARAYARWLGWE